VRRIAQAMNSGQSSSPQPDASVPPFAAVRKRGIPKAADFVRYVSSFEEAVNRATSEAREGDMILTLGAGSVSQLGPMLLEKLEQMSSAARV